MARRQPFAAVLLAGFLAATASAGEFIRINEDETATRLQTAVTHYEKDGAKVDLIGAIHIADKAYYQNLTARFATYDELLFEMVGGEKIAAAKIPPAEPPAEPVVEATGETDIEPAAEPGEVKPKPVKKEQDLSGLHKIYGLIARYLELTGQVDNINYGSANFVHADLTNAEFTQLEADRHESLLGFAFKLSQAKPDPSKQPDPIKLLRAVITGSANLLKLELVKTMGSAEDQIASLAGDSVIITDRNNRCLEVMQRELAAGHSHLGIFYGAAHFPDMEKRLQDLGFKRGAQEWLTAWDIPKTVKKLPSVQKPAAVTP